MNIIILLVARVSTKMVTALGTTVTEVDAAKQHP